MKAALHRLGQGIRALLAFAMSPDLGLAQHYLTQREFAAFQTLSRAEQLHSLNVLRAVLGAEPNAPTALSSAALLHDVGKSRYHLAVWQKTLSVLILAFAPGISRRPSNDDLLSKWRSPLVVWARHPKWSGEILRECGSESAVIWLAENHHHDAERYRDQQYYPLLLKLQAADRAS